MRLLNQLAIRFVMACSIIYRHLKSIDKYVIKSDDEDVEHLLIDQANKMKFQQEVDQLIRENNSTRSFKVGNKDITISI